MTSIIEAGCSTRECVHYLGIKVFREVEEDPSPSSVTHYCTAFPKEIPVGISHGNNLHLKPLKNQKNDIVFELRKKLY
ncbi:MAG: hypothetical protein ACYSWS_10445 [Planctomycetota bacterium]|jgi:hypothetical protein